MSDSESFPSQPQSGSSNHSQISRPADMEWLLALSKSKHPEQRKHAQRVICRLSEAEYRLAELRRKTGAK